MTKIIKIYKSEEERILNYVRNPLESINPDDAGGSNFVDPAAILAEARSLAEVKVQEAYAEGLRRGEEAGQTAFIESIGNAGDVLEQVTTELADSRAAFHNGLEEQVLELVRLVTAKILQREVLVDPEIVGGAVRGALQRLSDQESIVIRVNPVDLENIVDRKENLLNLFERLDQLSIVPDESVESGGCIAESESMQIDAQLSSQLTILIDGLLEQSVDGS